MQHALFNMTVEQPCNLIHDFSDELIADYDFTNNFKSTFKYIIRCSLHRYTLLNRRNYVYSISVFVFEIS